MVRSWRVRKAQATRRRKHLEGAAFPSSASLAIPGFSRNVPAVMHLTLLKSKVHRATVTGASLHYEGSLTISRDLAERVGLLPYEKILVGNMGNGERFETYVIYGEAGAGQIQLNGATAHLGKIGDRLTIMNFGSFTPEEAVGHRPRVIVLNEKNDVVRFDHGVSSQEFQVVV